MALRHKYTLVCDDVRVENTNKLIIIGVYGSNMTVPHVPFLVPSLTFLQAFEADGPANLGFRASIQHLGSGQKVAEALGAMGIPQSGHGFSVVKFANITFNEAGSYVFAIAIDTVPEQITANFDVQTGPTAQVSAPGPQH